MIDALGRKIDYLRISITDRCNMRCRYCMPVEVPEVAHAEVLRYEEFLQICQAAKALGINRFKVTGGEPLVRKGAVDFLAALKTQPGTRCVTLTTNGFFLEEALPGLKAAGVDGINVSLDSLVPDQFTRLTGVRGCERVVAAVKATLAAGFPTKINTVLLAQNQDQILPLAQLAEQMPLDVRFIELMPIGYGKDYRGLTEQEVFSLIKIRYPDLEPSYGKRGNGPAVYFKSRNLQGRIGFIAANTHKFCHKCNRMRLTSTGFLKPCLCYDLGVDLRSILRSGGTDLQLRLQEAIKKAVDLKPKGHCFEDKVQITETRSMNQIGG